MFGNVGYKWLKCWIFEKQLEDVVDGGYCRNMSMHDAAIMLLRVFTEISLMSELSSAARRCHGTADSICNLQSSICETCNDIVLLLGAL